MRCCARTRRSGSTTRRSDKSPLRVAILGAGPAGLYLAYLIKRRRGDAEVVIIEQNPPDATFGFGVVFSDRALEFLHADDPETLAVITPQLETWNDIALDLWGERIVIDGVGFAAIGRLQLLALLQERARAVGVEPVYRRAVTHLDELGDADLVVGADGVNSLVRRIHAQALASEIRKFGNRFAWFGTAKPFPTLQQTFRISAFGHFNAHHYRYAPDSSTFIVEVDADTFRRAAFDRMAPAEARAICESVFVDVLEGLPLISNNSVWRQFPRIGNARWSYGRYVLIGDALHTVHFSIGSGTRLAMEDAIALEAALARHPCALADALADYETTRRPIVAKLIAAADASGEWYERFAEHMRLAPIDFAMSYIQRSGRVDIERLRRSSPGFVARYERERPSAAAQNLGEP
jgi:2-polyprenyl-6-methoxyphenol hydroxylase-like FAD-dependent oxidoreductase